MKRARRQLTVALAAVLMCFGLVSVTAPSASAASGTISGTVQCFYGNNAEVGVWVNTNNGVDGWASLSDDGNGGKNYSYTLSQPDWYTLHVGCSGTPSSWGATMYTPTVNGNYYNWVCTYSVSLGYRCAMS